MMNPNCHLIWSSDFDFTEELKDDLRERLGDGLMDDALFAIACQENNDRLDDEKLNLKDIIPDHGICAVARLGLWNGTPLAILPSDATPDSVSECIKSYVNGMSDLTVYVDGHGDFRIDESHHDGTNQYLFRAWKADAADDDKDEVFDAACCGNEKALSDLLVKHTVRLGDDIGEVYGWSFPEPVPPEL